MPNECKYQPCSAEYEIHNEICKNRLACGRQFKRGTTYNHFLGPNTCSHCCYISSSYHYNQWRKETLKYAFATKCQNHQAGLEPDGGQKPFVSCKNLSVVRQIWPNHWKPHGADFSPNFAALSIMVSSHPIVKKVLEIEIYRTWDIMKIMHYMEVF